MGKNRLFLLTILLFGLGWDSASAQDTLEVSSNQNGWVQYHTKTDSNAHVFTLYGDGTFGQQYDPGHKFPPQAGGYITESYFVKAYDTNLPPPKRVFTGSVGSGSSQSNPVIKMSGQADLYSSWATAYGYENFFIIAFSNTDSSSAVNGCIELYYNSNEISPDTSDILVYNSWVKNRNLILDSVGSFNRKLSWEFTGLDKDEVRYVYVPATVLIRPGKSLSLRTTYKVNCTGSGSSQNSSFLSRRFPHDPNFKIVNRSCLKPHMPEESLEYTIGFFNDGNDFAHHVFLMDTLPPLLDPNSFALLDYEFQPNWNLIGHKLQLDFMGIFLPGTHQTIPEMYSYEDAFSYVKFKICTQPFLPNQTTILNTAAITFDTQPAFITAPAVVSTWDECTEFFPCNTGLRGSSQPFFSPMEPAILISPNPISEKLLLTIDFHAEVAPVFELNLLDFSGKVLENWKQTAPQGGLYQRHFSLPELPAGMYIMQLKSAQGLYHQKFVKL